MIEQQGDVDRYLALKEVWSDLVSDRDAIARDPGGKELLLAIRSLQRAAQITERRDLAEAAEAALSFIGGRVNEARAEVWPERVTRVQLQIAEIEAAARASMAIEISAGTGD